MKVGSLCTGYGGLDQGVQAAIGGETVWVSDIDKGACKLLTHRYPDVPNLGDFTRTDWSTVEPVDVLTAGFPCQPVSHAGKRLGMNDERWLWDDVARAVGELRPGLVVLENVRGLLSAGGGRLFGRVLGTLAALGYDASWHGLRAADVGAPHGRFRVFVVASPAEPGSVRRGTWRPAVTAETSGRRSPADAAGRGLLPSPRATDYKAGGPSNGAARHVAKGQGTLGETVVTNLLPTPRATRGGSSTETVELLPTPSVADALGGHLTRSGDRSNELLLPGVAKALALLPTPLSADAGPRGGTTGFGLRDWSREHDTAWGQYAPAIRRWEHVLGRTSPAPTELSAKGNPRLAAAFSEFLMGLPAGWITDVPGVTRNEALKLAGNGVVPQQAEAALRYLLTVTEVAA